MFNGFLVGKIIDSAIIGLLCFAGLSFMGFEAPAFIGVIIGITNIIPFRKPDALSVFHYFYFCITAA